MKKLYIILLIILCITPSFVAKAQDQEDAFMVWSTINVSKTLEKNRKWTLGVISEYRHQVHEGVSRMNQYLVRPSVAYKVLPWLTLKYQMDFAAVGGSRSVTLESGETMVSQAAFNWRFMPEFNMAHKVGDFSLSFRQRFQTTWKVKANTNSTVLRSRAKVDYAIPKTPVGLHFAIEPYWCDFSRNSFAWLQKIRWYAGFDFKLTDTLTFTPEYVCQAYHNRRGHYNRRTYDDHVIYMTLTIKL
jgi:hypothetical protein